MKQANKKSYDPSNGTRNEWKQSAEDEIIRMQEEIDELGLPEEIVNQLNKIVDKFKAELNTVLECATITPEIVFNEKELLCDCLCEISFGRAAASESELEQMIEIVTRDKSGTFVETQSLAEQIRLDEFLASMTINPYQLQLIA